jgi:putative molybdopterin biosynthesis protein
VIGGVFTVEDVAGLLKVSKATVYGMIERGQLAHFRVNNSIRVRREDLERITQLG